MKKYNKVDSISNHKHVWAEPMMTLDEYLGHPAPTTQRQNLQVLC